MEVFIILVGFILDRITKYYALSNLKDKDAIILIKNYFDFQYLENRGAAWGIFQNRLLLLSIVTISVLTVLILFLIVKKPKSKLLRISLSFIICGALGNLYDRIYYKKVVDFIHVHYNAVYEFPTFNVADIMVVIGTLLLALYIIRDGNHGEQ